MQGVDVDDTPVSYIKEIKVTTKGNDRTMLRKEPFLYKFTPKKDEEELDIKLEFMGHYQEPELHVAYKTTKSSSSKMYLLSYDPFNQEWKTDEKQIQHANIDIASLSIVDKEEKKEEEEVDPSKGYSFSSSSSDINPSMFVVEPRDDCTHIEEHFRFTKIPLQQILNIKIPSPCSVCTDPKECWLCLHCFQILCSRYVNSHQQKHYDETGHCLAASFSDLSVWCYKCDSYIKDRSINGLLRLLSDIKFGPGNKAEVVTINGKTYQVERTFK